MNIHETVKRVAKEKGVSLAKVEREAGLGAGCISHWRTNAPSVKNVVLVANVLGVDVADLMRE